MVMELVRVRLTDTCTPSKAKYNRQIIETQALYTKFKQALEKKGDRVCPCPYNNHLNT